MLKRIIEWSVDNKLIVLVFTAFLVAGGIVAMRRTPLEALPDLSDVQVIVQTDFDGQAPQIVEDQVTYPIATEMLKVPGSQRPVLGAEPRPGVPLRHPRQAAG